MILTCIFTCRSMLALCNTLITQGLYPGLIHSARGAGTFCAVDCYSEATRDKIVRLLRNKGFQMGGCGNMSIRFRPSLVFQPKHVHMFLEGMETVLKDVQ